MKKIDPNAATAACISPNADGSTVPTKPRRQRRMARAPGCEGEEGGQQPNKPAPEPRGPSKIAQVTALLKRPGGATLAELIESTGWLPHTTRAALTGLRKKGHTIDKTAREGTTVYSIAEAV